MGLIYGDGLILDRISLRRKRLYRKTLQTACLFVFNYG